MNFKVGNEVVILDVGSLSHSQEKLIGQAFEIDHIATDSDKGQFIYLICPSQIGFYPNELRLLTKLDKALK